MAEVLDAPVEAVDDEQQQDTLGFRPAKSAAPANDDLGFRPAKAPAAAPTPVADAPLELPVTVPNPTFPNTPVPASPAAPSDMPQMRAYEPTVGRQAWNTIANSAIGRSLQSTMPKFAAGIGLAPTEALQSPTYAQHGDQIIAPEYVKDAVSEILGFRKRGEPAQAPTPGQNRVEGALDAAGKITSGESLATIAGTSIAAALTAGVINPASAHVLGRLIAGGFTGDMLYGLYKQNKEYKKAVDAGDTATAQKIQGEMGVNGIMATLGALHTAGVGPHAETTSGAYGERGVRVGFGNAATAELGFRPAYRAPAPEGGYGEGSSVVPGKVTGAVTVGGKRFGTAPTVPAPTAEPIPPKELAAGAAAGQATAAHPDMAPAMEQATNEPQPVGAEDPDSKRTIVQPTNNPAVNQAMATAAMPKFTADLEDAVKAIPGASVAAAREEKNPKRLAEKINGEGKPAETIGDYGATQISVKSPEDKDAAVAAIKAKFPVVSEDDNFEKGDKDFGYRSHSMQVQTPTGGTVEVQIVPKEVFDANPEEHGNYKTAREARITGNDTEFARQAQEAKAKNDAAMEKFNARNDISMEKEGGRGESPEQAAAVTSHSSTSNDVAKGEVAASADTKQSGTEIPHNESRLAKIEKGSNVILPDGTAGTVKWTMGGKARVTTADGKQLPNVAVKDLKPAPTSTETPGPKWIGVDLDATLARYDGYKGPTNIGEPIPAMVDRVKQWLADGQAVKIFTARAKDPEAITAIEQWSEQHLGKKLPVTNVKDDKMTQLWDDRAVQVGRNSGEALGDPEQAAAEIGKEPQKENETQVSQERSGVPQPEGTAGGKEPAAEPVAANATEPARSGEGTGEELGSSKPASPVEEKRKAFVAKKPTAKELASTLQAQGKDVKVASDMDGAMFSLTGPTWYLKSEKLIDQKMRGPMTGDQVLRMLENGGVKADELKWTGLPEFLKGKFRVTPEQVKQQLADGGLQIRESLKGASLSPGTRTRIADIGEELDEMREPTEETQARWQALSDELDGLQRPERTSAPTKYGDYQLPGGANYRELLLTLPEKEPTGHRFFEENGSWHVEFPNGSRLGGWSNREDAVRAQGRFASNFKSGHWEEPNILAHIRFNDRTTPDGKRLLHIEELQSDWHQKGRDKGYQSESAETIEDAKRFFDIPDDKWKELTPEQHEMYRQEMMSDEKHIRKAKAERVPDAPFKKDWHEMAFRRAVRYAAENGYDGVSWTPGEKQAERYDLSKQVDRVVYHAKPQRLQAFKDGRSVMEQLNVPPEKVPDYVGKEVARKLFSPEHTIAGVAGPETNIHELRGQELKIGGAGMKGFYDKIIPDYARKFGKQWGAKVGEAKIKAGPEPDGLRIRENDAGDYEVMSGDKSLAKTSSYNEAEKMIDDLMTSGQMVPVPVLDITPEMRKSVVQQGVPMFRKDGQDDFGERTWNDDPKFVEASKRDVGENLLKSKFEVSTLPSGNRYLSLNHDAFFAFARILKMHTSWNAVTMPSKVTEEYNTVFKSLAKSGAKPLVDLRDAFDGAKNDYGHTIIASPTADSVALNEEFQHSWQIRYDLQPVVIQSVASLPLMREAKALLKELSYDPDDARIMVAEATAKAAVDASFMTLDSRRAILSAYREALKENGVSTVNIPEMLPDVADIFGGQDGHGSSDQRGSEEPSVDQGDVYSLERSKGRQDQDGLANGGGEVEGGRETTDGGNLFSRSPDATGDRDESEPLRDLVDRIKAQKAEKRNLLDRFKKESQRSIDSLKGGASAVARGLASIKGISAAAWDSYRRPPAWTDFKDATGKFQAAEQFADHAMNEFADEIKRVVPDKAKREAMTNWVEADGSDATLKSRANSLRDLAKNVARWKDKQSIPAPWMETVSKVVMNAEATGKSLADVAKKLDSMAKGYDLARELSPDEKKLSGHIREYLDTQLDNAIKSGLISHSFWQNYITHIYEGDTRGIQALINFGELAPNPAFIKKRVFATYFEGEMFGMMPRDKDIGYLTAAYHDAFTKALASRAYIGSLLEGKASDGRPLAILGSRGRWVQLNPDQMVSIQEQRKRPDSLGDYRTVDHPSLRNWNWELTDKDAEEVSPKLFDDPEKALAIQGDLMLHPEIAKKVGNILGKSAVPDFLGGTGRVALKVSTTLKQSLLSFSGFHQTQEGLHAMEHKILPAKMPDLDFDNPTQRALVEHGLVVANFDGQSAFSEGVSGTELTQHIPLIGNLLHSYQDYLFRSYIPRLKMAMATHALQRNRMRYRGKLNDDQILEMTANQANAAFGGLNYKMMGRNKTFQDLLRLVLLAPDFLEARARFAAQATKPFGQEQRSALLRGALIFYAIARILNAILNDGDMKLEPSMAFSVNYKGHRVGLRTVQGDILRLATDPRSFAFNRLNPMTTRPAVEFITGRDQFGRQKDITSQGKDYLKSAVPIPAQGYLNNMDTSWPESIANALGLETGKYRSPAEQEAFRQHLLNIPDKPEDEDKIAESRQNKKLEDKLRDGRMTSAELWDMVGPGKPLTPKQAGDITKRAANQPIVNYAKNLSIEQMIPVFEKANVAERDLLRPELYKKSAELANRPDKERAKLQSQLDRLMEEDQKYQAKR